MLLRRLFPRLAADPIKKKSGIGLSPSNTPYSTIAGEQSAAYKAIS